MSHHNLFFIANFTENQYIMAKTITDEQMKLSIIINGDSAQKELFDLEKSTRALTESNKGLLLQKQLLAKPIRLKSLLIKLKCPSFKKKSD